MTTETREEKDIFKKKIGKRIRQARKMAGFSSCKVMTEAMEGWSGSRLANYEQGFNIPHPVDLLAIAQRTDTSPCWIMFGSGPIRSNHRDQQAIRHQNLTNIYDEEKEKRGGITRLAKALGISRDTLNKHIDNPFKPISDSLAAKFEKHLKLAKGWMNEQHVEHDPLCLSFPEDIRELMAVYSGLSPAQRETVLAVVKTLGEQLNQ